MNFYKLTFDFPDEFYFLDLNYTTQEDGETYHWFLCLNTGTKQQIKTRNLRLLQSIEYSDIDQTLETKCQQ